MFIFENSTVKIANSSFNNIVTRFSTNNVKNGNIKHFNIINILMITILTFLKTQ